MNKLNKVIKCRYFNHGYCKKKIDCEYFHPVNDCDNECSNSTCPKRHRLNCCEGNECYYNSINKCEFKHDETSIQIKKKSEYIKENMNLVDEIAELKNNIDKKDDAIFQLNLKLSEITKQNEECVKRMKEMDIKMNDISKKNEEMSKEVKMLKEVEKNGECDIEMVEVTSDKKEELNNIGSDLLKENLIKVSKEDTKGKITDINNCASCEINFKDDYEFLDHIELKHKEVHALMNPNMVTDYKCNKCGKIESSKDGLRKHMKKYHHK